MSADGWFYSCEDLAQPATVVSKGRESAAVREAGLVIQIRGEG